MSRQLTFSEVPTSDGDEGGRTQRVTTCEAYANSTGERCRREPIDPFPYCSDHLHLLDDVDLRRIGLKPPKSPA